MNTREFSRPQRVAEQIRRELSDIFSRDVRDPRFPQLTISAVEVSRDLSNAKVFIIAPEDHNIASLLKIMKKATTYLRRNLAERLNIRVMPALRFVHDQSMENALRLSALIDEAMVKDSSTKSGED